MTQEELDKLMNADNLDDLEVEQTNSKSNSGSVDASNYNVSATLEWPPPPPLTENKVVHQLDDVTKESEEKATQIFDMLEHISDDALNGEETSAQIVEALKSTITMMQKLGAKFPQISVFATQEAILKDALEKAENINSDFGIINMNCLSAMDIMQYQDIHRQKIERVINIMRALTNYMNKLFEGRIDDDKRVSSAKHIHGDSTEDVVNEEDIEALIAAFGQK